MSKAHLPPVPPAGRSPQGGPATPKSKSDDEAAARNARDRDTHEQGRQGNINQNTRNQGFQQDR